MPVPSWAAHLAAAVARRVARPAHVVRTETPPPPAEELVDFLRQFGVALCRAGDAANRVTTLMDRLAAAYGMVGAHFFVLPTGVFVRIGSGHTATVDFAPTEQGALRLDQIGRVYDLMDEALTTRMAPAEGVRRLDEILASPPRVPGWLRLVGHAVLTAGLGLVLNANPEALAAYLVLGTVVGALALLANRVRVLDLALPVVAALVVTVLVHQFGDVLHGVSETELLIPPLVTFLPGAALTMGAVEIAAGSLVGGSSRMVSGFYVLMLLAFGILAGAELTGDAANATTHTGALGWWAPFVGVLVFGIGQYLYSSAPARSMPWLLATLYLAWGAQYLTGHLGLGILNGFVGGVVVIALANLAGRHRGPPAQVVFLPAFWLLVPGALGLSGVSELVGASTASGLADLLTAALTVVAIALGVLVGSSLVRTSLVRVVGPAPDGMLPPEG